MVRSQREELGCLGHRQRGTCCFLGPPRSSTTLSGAALRTSHDPACSSGPGTRSPWGKFTSAGMSPPGFNSWSHNSAFPRSPKLRGHVEARIRADRGLEVTADPGALRRHQEALEGQRPRGHSSDICSTQIFLRALR